jgi:hypothetical protein
MQVFTQLFLKKNFNIFRALFPTIRSIDLVHREHCSRPKRALLPTLQSTALYTYGVLLPMIQSTAPYGTEHCSIWYGALLILKRRMHM